MRRTRAPYATVFREQTVELGPSGPIPEELAWECEPSARAIRNWMAQTGRDVGKGSDGQYYLTRCSTLRPTS